ncbi:MAG: ABC transporter permease [Peptococcaceae bacterium]|jgi:putative ABC transport system permease protein|nr:ABC transporter permease [Peptococcaceae bacterium]
MNSIDLIRMGLGNLLRRKTRTFLTVLGVVIGTAAIVTMLSLGFGMQHSFQQQISRMGSMTVIDVYPSYDGGYYGVTSSRGRSSSASSTLDDKAITQFNQLEGVQAVSPEIETYLRLVSGRYVGDMLVKGINPEIMADFVPEISEGRLLQKGDGANLVFGSQTIYNFYDGKARDPWRYMGYYDGSEPKVNVLKDKLTLTFDFSYGMRRSPGEQGTSKQPRLYKVKGVGILQQGQNESDYVAYMNIDELKKIIQDNARNQNGNDAASRQALQEQLKYQRAKVKVKDIKYVQGVQDAINEMGFQTHSLNDILKSMQEQSRTIQLILGGIGAISLLVAALGITNTMIMSIYERTREIGIMKVIGAALRDIKRLFLFEAGMIGFLGGLLGIGISFLLSFLLNTLSGSAGYYMGMGGEVKISVIPLWLVFAVIALSTLVGLVSGYYPARRAMKLSALEAIKTE